MAAPASAPVPRLNTSRFAGTSGSVASAVNVSSRPSFTTLSPMPASTGAWFTSATVMVIASKSLRRGVPASVMTTPMT